MLDVARVDVRRVDPFEFDVHAQMHAAMLAGLDDAGVRVAQRRVFAGDGNRYFLASALPMRSTNHCHLMRAWSSCALVHAIVQIQQRQHFAIDVPASRSDSGIR